MQLFAYRYDNSGPWREKRESRMVSLVYLVYFVCRVERDKPDEQNRLAEPIPRIDVSRGKVARRVGCIRQFPICSISSRN